jgi:hypothetical protein
VHRRVFVLGNTVSTVAFVAATVVCGMRDDTVLYNRVCWALLGADCVVVAALFCRYAAKILLQLRGFRAYRPIARRVTALATVCVVAFLSRGVYALLLASSAVQPQYFSGEHGRLDWFALVTLLSEWVPCSLVLMLLLASAHGATAEAEASWPDTEDFGAGGALSSPLNSVSTGSTRTWEPLKR